ncbi:MAG: T9SS type A sorting domain-containing protein, partial [Flavobacteriales bacterium]
SPLGETQTYRSLADSSLVSGEYKFKYQKIESGSTVVEETIKKSDYAGMDMIHYDVVENEVVEREPSADWQFIIGKYTDFAPTPYPVVGVRIKQGMEVVKIANTHPNDVVLSGLTFTEEINTIGYNWKTFNMGTFSYEIADSTSYVIKEDNGAMHHFYFTEYEGSSTGVVKLMYKGHSVGTNEYAQEKMVALSKNPVSKNETFVLQSNHTMTSVNVYNTNGQLVQAISPELNQVDLQINNTGLYIIESVVNGEKQVNKLIVK